MTDRGSSRRRSGSHEGGAVELLWIPLGAGAHVVRASGRVYESLCAVRQHREPQALYHSALRIELCDARYVVEMTPVPDDRGAERGVVAEGAVGSEWARWLRVFRYEVRCWRNGVIPDLAHAVRPPTVVVRDGRLAALLLDVVRMVPTPVWGRDQLRTGEMWNSNSVTAWLLAVAGADVDGLGPPAGGRAPGWDAGLVLARRMSASAPPTSAGAPRWTSATLVAPREVAPA